MCVTPCDDHLSMLLRIEFILKKNLRTVLQQKAAEHYQESDGDDALHAWDNGGFGGSDMNRYIDEVVFEPVKPAVSMVSAMVDSGAMTSTIKPSRRRYDELADLTTLFVERD